MTVFSILNDLIYRYDVDFTLVLPSNEIMSIYKEIKP